MKTTSVHNLMALAVACSVTLIFPTLFAQSTRVPVGRPAPLTTQQPSLPNGAVARAKPQAPKGGGLDIRQSFDGVDFLGSNCPCLPPDTNAAVGNGYVVETVNVQIRVFDKSTGNILLDEPLSSFFGAPSGGDVYVVYDDNADRWYVSAFDSTYAGLFLAVSKTGNPLDGFPYVYDLVSGI